MNWIMLISSLCSVGVENGTLKNVIQSQKVDHLNLSGLKLTNVAEGTFVNVTHLKELDLSNNLLTTLPCNILWHMKCLEHLSLANNNLTDISHLYLFRSLHKLKVLNLSQNEALTFGRNSFFGLPDTTEIKTINLPVNSLNSTMFCVNDVSQVDPATPEDFYTNCRDSINDLIEETRQKDKNLWDRCMYNFNNDLNDLNPAIFCTKDGYIERVDIATGDLAENCTIIDTIEHSDGSSLTLRNETIRGFREYWFRLPYNFNISKVRIEATDMSEIDEYILNYLTPCILDVTVTENNIEVIKSNVIRNNYIRYLSLENNGIENIEHNALKNTKLERLNLNNNNISDLEFVASLPSTITELSLDTNDISCLPDGTFSRLPYLMHLNLDHNKVKQISRAAFNGLHYLGYLSLSNNRITRLDKGNFDDLICVREFNLNHNCISSIEKGFARKMNRLMSLWLEGNRVKKFDNGLFYGMPLNGGILTVSNLKSFKPGIFKLYE